MLYLGAPLRTPSSFSRGAKSAASLDREYELALSGPLEDRGHALAATDAHGFKAVADLLAFHLMHQGGHDANAGGADRMAERDTRTVDVENCAIIHPRPLRTVRTCTAKVMVKTGLSLDGEAIGPSSYATVRAALRLAAGTHYPFKSLEGRFFEIKIRLAEDGSHIHHLVYPQISDWVWVCQV